MPNFQSDKLYNPRNLLKFLRSKGRGLHTSIGENYNNAIFGRDSLISSKALLAWDSTIARETILTLAALQGTRNSILSDEEPGKIHHESREYNAWLVNPFKKIKFMTLSHLWGGNYKKMLNYFSMDATPLYISLVAEYAKIDPDILNNKIIRNDGIEITIEQTIIEAALWIINHMGKSGLVRIKRFNPIGLAHQTWKDSLTSYIHSNGKIVNIINPVNYLIIQAVAVDGLDSAANLIKSKHPNKSIEFKKAANTIRDATIADFWLEKEQHFASAIDKDIKGKKRRLRISQSDPGWLLNTSIFDNLSNKNKQKYITSIVKELFSDDFLTDAGIRCRSLKYVNKLQYNDYHGSSTTWPIDTFMFAEGLRRQGFIKLAQQLENRILNTINHSGNSFEFYYVQPDGKVLYDPESARHRRNNSIAVDIQMQPESNIAWTVAAIYAIKYRNKTENIPKLFKDDTKEFSKWRIDLENDILGKIKNIKAYKNHKDLNLNMPEQPNLFLNIKKGNRISILSFTGQLIGQYAQKIKYRK